MVQTGSLPVTGKITFDFSEQALMLVAKGLSNQLAIRAIISFPDQPSTTDKHIGVVVTKVRPAGTMRVDSKSIFTETFFSTILEGGQKYAFGRVRDYLHNQILIKMGWLLIGYLEGPKKIPIMILYIPLLGFGTYSFKKDCESMEEFNARLN